MAASQACLYGLRLSPRRCLTAPWWLVVDWFNVLTEPYDMMLVLIGFEVVLLCKFCSPDSNS